MSEQYAIDLCIRERDPKGFAMLFVQYRREAYYHAYGFLGDKEEALDACQEAFSKAFSAIVSLPRLDAFYPWFYCILKNHCINILQRQSTRIKNVHISLPHQQDAAETPVHSSGILTAKNAPAGGQNQVPPAPTA